MKPIDRSEILPLGEYENVRDRFRNRVIGEKKLRRFSVGERVSGVFENRDTVLLQIQEMLRTERITRESAIAHEIGTYNELVPGPNEVSATLMIEIDDKAERDAFLVAARGIERVFGIEVDGESFVSIVNPTRELEDRASAVMYLKFALSDAAVKKVSAGSARVSMTVKHAAYEAATPLGESAVKGLAEDFTG